MSERKARAKSKMGETNWQETRLSQNKPHSLDTCPEQCTQARPHKIASGLYVCAECWAYENSDRPIMSAEMRP